MKMTREQAKEQIKHGLSRLNDALAEGRSEELEHYCIATTISSRSDN